ncbi:Ubiquitin thioesterase OTUB1, partial [Fragariocoptes setiger]
MTDQNTSEEGPVIKDTIEFEGIRNQERLIEKEIAAAYPLVGEELSVLALKDDYQPDDVIYQRKIDNLEARYTSMRRTRPDGNCFYRAFSFAYFESLLNNKEELIRFKKFVCAGRDELIKLGFTQFTIDDFFDVFMDILNKIENGSISSSEKLLDTFCEQAISDYIVVYFRLMTSGYLQQNGDTFINFIEGSQSVLDFCKQEVEPMYKESDHIHVVALTSASNVCTRIIYMDRGSSTDTVNAHDFPDQEPPLTPRIHLLYRPGHYDILYPKST